jgi:hypothetical protein
LLGLNFFVKKVGETRKYSFKIRFLYYLECCLKLEIIKIII